MQTYVDRLISCGFSPSDAYYTCCNFLREFSLFELVSFIVLLEEGVNVGILQS